MIQRSVSGRRGAAGVAAFLACAAVATAGAARAAGGGTTIADASAVQLGHEETGDTSTSSDLYFPGIRTDWWKVDLAAGDAVTIDWQVLHFSNYGQNLSVEVFPAGTTDFNISNNKAIATQTLGANGKNELTFTAPAEGTYPLLFENDPAMGSTVQYSFVVTVTHAAPSPPTTTTTGGKTKASPPAVKALPATGKAGSRIKLRWRDSDSTGEAQEQLTVTHNAKRLLSKTTSLGPRRPHVVYYVRWKTPRIRGRLRFCVTASDTLGLSRRSCAAVTLR